MDWGTPTSPPKGSDGPLTGRLISHQLKSPKRSFFLGGGKWGLHQLPPALEQSSPARDGILASPRGGKAGRKLLCGGGGGGGWTEAHLPNPPLPLLGRRAGKGVWVGTALPAMPEGGGGGPTPTYMAQNDPHFALIILTTHMWGKIFS